MFRLIDIHSVSILSVGHFMSFDLHLTIYHVQIPMANTYIDLHNFKKSSKYYLHSYLHCHLANACLSNVT